MRAGDIDGRSRQHIRIFCAPTCKSTKPVSDPECLSRYGRSFLNPPCSLLVGNAAKAVVTDTQPISVPSVRSVV